PVAPELLSPFCAVRSDDVLRLVRERFDIVLERTTGYLAPLGHLLDLDAMEREAPELLDQLRRAEAAGRDDPGLQPSSAWVVCRRRSQVAAPQNSPGRGMFTLAPRVHMRPQHQRAERAGRSFPSTPRSGVSLAARSAAPLEKGEPMRANRIGLGVIVASMLCA